jgi:hypothetical protein
MRRRRSPFVHRILDWVPELFFLAVTTAVGLWAGGRWLDPTGDPGFAWSLAYRLAEGDVLYRDVYLAYGPLSPYLLAGLGRLFEFSAGYLVLSSWIAAVVAGVLLLRCGRPFLSTLERIAAACLILAFSLWAPGPGRLVFPYYPGVVHALALSLGAILVVRNARLSVRAQCAFAGVLSGLAFLAKQEIGLAVLIALLASLLLRPNELLSRGARTIAAFAMIVGAALGAILLVSGVTLDGLRDPNHVWPLDPVPPGALNQLFRLAAGMSSTEWAFDVRKAAWCLLVQVGLVASAGLLAARTRKVSHWLPVLGLAFALLSWWAVERFQFSTRAPVALSSAIAFLVAALAIAARRLENREQLVAIGTFAGLAGLRAVFSPTQSGPFDGSAHFVTSLTWVVFLCVFAPRIFAPEPRAATYARRMTAIFLLVTAVYGARVGAEHLRFAWREPVSTLRGTIFLDPPKASFFRSLSREIRSGEKVLVLPEINAVDVLCGARSVSPLQDHLPGWLDLPLENELVRRLEATPPDAVVLFERTLYEFGVSRFGDGYGQRIAGWIASNYRPVLSERAGSLLRRKTRPGPF